MVGAVLYVRVSTKEQTENLSLATQLRGCEEYCLRHGYQVQGRFTEEGESAKTADRPELQKLLKFCRTNKGKVHFVVVFNLTRFAREKYDHFALRAHLKSLGISLRSATEPIDDTSTGKLMEGVLAAFAQFDNDVRSDRTRTGMRAALEIGRWTFLAPLGYLNAPRSQGTSLVPDPDRAPFVKQAFEEFASALFTQKQVLSRVSDRGLRTQRGNPVTPQVFIRMLRNRLYAGVIEVPKYGVMSVHGDFEPLVSEETFYRVQAVLQGRVVAAAPQQRSNPDFPLKCVVRCETCGRPVTGSWSKGKMGQRYPYYHCRRRCPKVNIAKAALEGLFVDKLKQLQPTPGYMRLLNEHVLRAWHEHKAGVRQQTREVERRAKATQQKLDQLDEKFIYAQAVDQATYDRQRDKLREELTLTRIDRHASDLEGLDVEGVLSFAERVLPNASDLWVQASLNQKQRLQQLFFPDGLRLAGKRLVRTRVTFPAFKDLGFVERQRKEVVDQRGIEPLTS